MIRPATAERGSTRLRHFGRVVAASSLVALLLSSQLNGNRAAATQLAGQRFNVLFIVVDDLNLSLGCYGNRTVKTPNIDRLAQSGTRFRHAYCQYPLCNPSRTSFLSGRRPESTGVWNNVTPPRTYLKDMIFLPEYFKQAGYYSAVIGKVAHEDFESDLKIDLAEDVAQFYGGRDHKEDLADDPVGIPWAALDEADDQEPDGRIARRAVEVLEQNKDKPFFIGVGFKRPHRPYIAPKKYFDIYQAADRAEPPAEWSDERKTAWVREHDVKHYYACVSYVDAQVGIIMDALRRLDLAQKTIIVLFGDNGFHLGEHGGLWRKQTLWEEALRIPLIIAAPNQAGGQVCERLVELVDLFPSLAQMCGLPVPDDMEGTSLLPLLKRPGRAWKRAAFSMQEKRGAQFGVSVRTRDFHYIQWGFGEPAQLFDLRVDPREENNVADDFAYGGVVVEMRTILQGWWKSALPERH
jgi:iduronate 2-sulfatase